MQNWSVYISLLLNLVLGGSFLVNAHTLRSIRKKAAAEATGAEYTTESKELDNVEKAIKIWREMAESLKLQLSDSQAKYDQVATQVEELRKDVQKLNTISNRILRMLDKITHDNMEKMVETIKDEIQKGN